MDAVAPPSAWLARWAHLLPTGTQALDVACGSGRHMHWLHACGLHPTGVDRDAQALAHAARWGEVLCADIEGGPWPLAGRCFGAVVVTNYLWRPLLPAIAGAVAPGGVLLYETFAQGNETVGRPARTDFLLRPGELLAACHALRVIAYEDGFEDAHAGAPARFVQRIAAVRTPEQTTGVIRLPLQPPGHGA